MTVASRLAAPPAAIAKLLAGASQLLASPAAWLLGGAAAAAKTGALQLLPCLDKPLHTTTSAAQFGVVCTGRAPPP